MQRHYAKRDLAGSCGKAPCLTDAEIAAQLGISRSRVFQIRLRAMAKIKQAVLDDPCLRELAEEFTGKLLGNP